MKLSFNAKRIGAGILLLIGLLCVANYYFELEILGRFDREAMIGIFIMMFIYLSWVGPTFEEIQEYRDRTNRDKGAPIGLRLWKYVVAVLAVMLMFVLIGPVLQLARDEPVQEDDWLRLVFIELLVLVAGLVGWFQLTGFRRRKMDRQ